MEEISLSSENLQPPSQGISAVVRSFTFWFAIPLEGQPVTWIPMQLEHARYALKCELLENDKCVKSFCLLNVGEETIRELIKIIEHDHNYPKMKYPGLSEPLVFRLLDTAQKILNTNGLGILYEALEESIELGSRKEELWSKATWCKLLDTFDGRLQRVARLGPDLEYLSVQCLNDELRKKVIEGLKDPVNFVMKRSLGLGQ